MNTLHKVALGAAAAAVLTSLAAIAAEPTSVRRPTPSADYPAPELPADEPGITSSGGATPALALRAAIVSPAATALNPPVTITYSGGSDALTINDTGTGRGITASLTNANNINSALYGQTSGQGAGLTGFNNGTKGPGGKFQVTNTGSAQAGMYATTVGTGPAVLGTITSASAQYGQSAIVGMHSGGETASGSNGRYGNAGHFSITNTNNFDSVLVATTSSGMGTAVEGDDYSSAGGVGTFGYSSHGESAEFTGGSGGNGTCSYSGGSGWNCPGGSAQVVPQPADEKKLLANLDRMPISYYRISGQRSDARHLGPTAEDFHAAFQLGDDTTKINTGDAQGVALTAAKGLYRKLKSDEAVIAADHAHIVSLEERLKAQEISLEAAMAELKATNARFASAVSPPQAYIAER